MGLSQRLLHISVLMGALWLCLAAAHDILEVDADATMTATVEVPTAKEVEELGWKIEAQLALMHEAHEHLIRIETLTRCPAEDIRDTPGRAWPGGPQEDKEKREQQRWRWCKSVPELVFPSGQVPDWDFEALYTMNWTNVDDAYAQRFQWRTRHCGKLNKTLQQGQRSMQFIFKEMAAEFPKKQCDYTTQSANAAVVWEWNCLASKRRAGDDTIYALDAGPEVVIQLSIVSLPQDKAI
ncbi:uncharacterized protein LMH87_008361 [Akanthomyces muscarius]|uniref:Uncharacterized protein n=1 Tax=Akanthomyces muscarius TaxID=2231603 RepID=A0A9W8QK98_AKAMU|nr:uncharacterized protein LMH87_008361 [Akanthomyces muscarius]KAJ4159461.1 hypothetical protein LMH87_008361 [Akanthomyces muscarius]